MRPRAAHGSVQDRGHQDACMLSGSMVNRASVGRRGRRDVRPFRTDPFKEVHCYMSVVFITRSSHSMSRKFFFYLRGGKREVREITKQLPHELRFRTIKQLVYHYMSCCCNATHKFTFIHKLRSCDLLRDNLKTTIVYIVY